MAKSGGDSKMNRKRARVSAILVWFGANWIAMVALLVSIVSVGFTYLQMRDAKTATALAVRPFVDLFIQDDDDQPIAGIRIKNEGPGVGTIKDVTYYVDRKLVGDQDAAIKRFNIASGKIRYTSFDEGDNLAVNDDPWLFYMRRHQVTKQQFESFIDFIDNHVAVKVKFCSAQGECWTKCSTPGMC